MTTPPNTPPQYYGPPVRTNGTNGFAIASFVLALLGMSLLAVIFGHLALSQIKRTAESGSGLAIAGLIIGYLAFAALIIIVAATLVALLVAGASSGFRTSP